MFICSKCKTSKRSGQQVVVETREKDYYEDKYIEGKKQTVYMGSGTEIVREERVCSDCL